MGGGGSPVPASNLKAEWKVACSPTPARQSAVLQRQIPRSTARERERERERERDSSAAPKPRHHKQARQSDTHVSVSGDTTPCRMTGVTFTQSCPLYGGIGPHMSGRWPARQHPRVSVRCLTETTEKETDRQGDRERWLDSTVTLTP